MRHISILVFILSACGGSQEPPPSEGDGESCATVTCPGNQACVETETGTTCACTSMAMCVDGFTWDDERCECVEAAGSPTPGDGTCTADGDCRKEDNYCGGCHCLALGPGEEAPTCDDPVQCFARPCGVTAGEPACVDGRCVLR